MLLLDQRGAAGGASRPPGGGRRAAYAARGEAVDIAGLAPSAANVVAVYRMASMFRLLDGTVDGSDWYVQQRDLIHELDPADPARAAAVIAVLSPMTPWPRNVRLAREAYAQHAEWLAAGGVLNPHPLHLDWRRLGCLGHNSRKAFRILDGEDPDRVVRGPKVRAFWRSLQDPFHPTVVVVDRHAADIACGQLLDDARRLALLDPPGAYEEFCQAYRDAAAQLRAEGEAVTPGVVQAVCWTFWRRTFAAGNARA